MRDQRGSASLLVVTLSGVVLLLGLAAAFLTATAAAHRRAQAAADLAALAAATSASDGSASDGQDPCSVAGSVATRNGARLTGCSPVGADMVVTVSVGGPEFLGHSWVLDGRARAGPG
jgi:secretion/DNA translocation related TadE-like protein